MEDKLKLFLRLFCHWKHEKQIFTHTHTLIEKPQEHKIFLCHFSSQTFRQTKKKEEKFRKSWANKRLNESEVLQVFPCFEENFLHPHIRRYYLIYFHQNCLIIAFMPLRSIRYEISGWFFRPIKSTRLARNDSRLEKSNPEPVRMIQLVDLSLDRLNWKRQLVW